ncbi:MAG TPA: DUF72 domain-containing protein [Rhizomicrobium sp.]|jgi:uncharacterized protein YecE (DUF72 family)|nr:DUF72 domain-containing protein [Rhizomicrobium sp.]
MIRVGIGGWNYPPWRGTFYPKGLPQAKELEFASRALTTIEINATYHRLQKPDSFRKWADTAPDNFQFSVKAWQFATAKRNLAEGGPLIEKFLDSGFTELKSKLGPIVWQFTPARKFEPENFAAFFALLPETLNGITLRHAIEVRHESFLLPEFIALARKHNVATVLADSPKYPLLADVTADFVYMRLQRTEERVATGYTSRALKQWTERAKACASGAAPAGLPLIAKAAPKKTHDVFVYFISGAKVRAPAAAMAMLAELKG